MFTVQVLDFENDQAECGSHEFVEFIFFSWNFPAESKGF